MAGNVEWGMWRGSADGKRREEVDLKENFKNLSSKKGLGRV